MVCTGEEGATDTVGSCRDIVRRAVGDAVADAAIGKEVTEVLCTLSSVPKCENGSAIPESSSTA